jgi:hypothetical protein
MRNVFDQYDQPENKLTHALVSALSNEPALLRPFLNWLGIRSVPLAAKLRVAEQQIPGILASGDEESEGVPDACIFDGHEWIVLLESKVQAPLRVEQLRRHLKSAERRGYERPWLVAITLDPVRRELPERTVARQWRDVYHWFSSRQSGSEWAKRLVEYMEVFESKMSNQAGYLRRGMITMFTGLCFDDDNPYTCQKGKRLIKLLGDELQRRKDLEMIGVDPGAERRRAIKGSGLDRVWDFLPLKVARAANEFTEFPHLTVGIGPDDADAAVTIPNAGSGPFRAKLKALHLDGFRRLVSELEAALRPVLRRSPGAKPYLYLLQRHSPRRSLPPEVDGRLEFDLRTIASGSEGGVKFQPEWVEAGYDLLVNKRSNMQLGLRVHFRYDCPVVRSPQVVGLFADTWKALEPLIACAVGS